jgi:rod shape-determining protein MreD
MRSDGFGFLTLSVVVLLAQVLILNNIQFLGFVNPFLYVMIILVLPLGMSRHQILLLGLILGFLVDLFSSTIGLHMSATLVLAYMRFFILKYLAPRDGFEFNSAPSISEMGLAWFISYSSILVVIHHLFLFSLESLKFAEIGQILIRTLSSGIFTLFLIIAVELLRYRRKAQA